MISVAPRGRGTLFQLSTVAGAQGAAAAALLALNVLLAGQLGPERFGTYSLFLAVASAATIPFAWVLSAVLVFGQEDTLRHGHPGRTIAAIALHVLIIGGAVLVVGAVAYRPILDIFPALSPVLALAAAYVLGNLLLAIALGVLQSTQDFTRYSALIVLNGAAPLLTIGSAVTILGPDISITLTALILTQILVPAVFVAPYLRWLPQATFDRRATTALTRYVLAYAPGAAQSYVLQASDVLIVGALVDARSLGAYTLAARIYRQMLVAVEAFGTVALPVVDRRRIAGEQDFVVAFVDRRVPQLLSLAAIAATLVAVGGGLLIGWTFGDRYDLAPPIFAIMMVALVWAGWRRLLSPVLTSYRMILSTNIAGGVAAVAFIAAAAGGAQVAGAHGVAAAAAVASIVEMVIVVRAIPTRVGGSTTPRVVMVAGAGTALVTCAAVSFGSPVLQLALVVPAAVAYVALVRWSRLFAPIDVVALADATGPARGIARGALSVLVGRPSA